MTVAAAGGERYQPSSSQAATSRAVRLTWFTLAFFLLAVIVGFGWDRAWHATHPFEDFWSPPHIFIYTTLAITAGIVFRAVRDNEVRECFGREDVTLAIFGPLPSALFLPVAGIVTIFSAGALDSVWHSTFGLDETGWSLPHAMLGWGLLLTLFGLVAARMAIAGAPIGWLGRGLLALLVVSSVTGVLLGPLGSNNTPEVLRAIASLPVLATESEAQHTFRIYLEWNISRTAPLFVPVAALASGMALRLGRGLVPNAFGLLLIVTVATLFSMSGELRTARYFGIEDDPQNWLPVPFLPAFLAFLVCRGLRCPETVAWLVAGLTFGVVATSWWEARGSVALVAAPVMLVGARLGGAVEGVIRSPTPVATRRLALTWGLVAPLCLGAVDLYLRANTA
ncbi:MAG TPA: hypothetical protein VFZ12_07220 [Dehalococcoidia bacterium]|nr:hypothetical protein [Dehalococcoidia bacterium]